MAQRYVLAAMVFVASVSAQTVITLPTGFGPQLGTRVLAIHDINGDGVEDYVASAPAQQPTFGQLFNGGQVIAYSGSDSSVLWATAIVNDGNNAGRGLGLADWNGDGIDEIVSVRQWTYLFGVAPAIDIHDSMTGALLSSMALPASLPWTSVGDRIAAADLDGNGLEEVIVAVGGSPESTLPSQPHPTGAVVIFDAAATAPTILSDPAVEDFGRGVYTIGDYNLDGSPDFVVTAPYATHYAPGGPFSNAGLIRVVSGANFSTIVEFWGYQADQELGRWFLPVGDFHVDGIIDLGLIRKSNSALGPVYDFEIIDGIVHTITLHPLPSDFVPGRELKFIGDVDADGVVDLGISGSFPGLGLEGLELISMSDFRELERLLGPSISSGFGHDFAAIPDGDGDGRWDLAIGEPLANATAGQITRHSVLPVLSKLGDGSPTHDLLQVNGSAALPSRRVDLAVGQAFTIGVNPDPTTGQATDFIIWGLIGTPNQGSVYNVVGGSFLFAPRIAAPGLPWLFTLTDSVGYDAAALIPGSQAPWSLVAPFGLAMPIDLTLQGVTISAGNIDITNGIILSVR